MNKLMMASLSVLLAGATVTTAFAQDGGRRAGGESSWEGAGKGPAREAAQEARGDRREDRGDNDQDVRTSPRGDHRFAGGWAGREWQAQQHQRDDDGGRNYTPEHDRGRDYTRDRDHDHDRDGGRNRHARHDWGNDRHDWHQDHHRDSRYYTRYRDSRWNGYHWNSRYRYRAPVRYIYPSGYRPYQWQVGYQLPYNYYSANYYHIDYRAYRLPPPPYGYQWIRVDRDVVLVSIATGLIRDVLYGLFY